MENARHEAQAAVPDEAYEYNHAELLELMGHINARLATNYRTDKPRAWDHVGGQEEVLAMLRSVAEFLGA